MRNALMRMDPRRSESAVAGQSGSRARSTYLDLSGGQPAHSPGDNESVHSGSGTGNEQLKADQMLLTALAQADVVENKVEDFLSDLYQQRVNKYNQQTQHPFQTINEQERYPR